MEDLQALVQAPGQPMSLRDKLRLATVITEKGPRLTLPTARLLGTCADAQAIAIVQTCPPHLALPGE